MIITTPVYFNYTPCRAPIFVYDRYNSDITVEDGVVVIRPKGVNP